jgi:hypothetical protein
LLNLTFHGWTASPPCHQLGDQEDHKQCKEDPCESDAGVNAGEPKDPQYEEYGHYDPKHLYTSLYVLFSVFLY